ncbi:Ltp family lipoprotein [Staphylococcus sp. EZ-P03]|uniref:Ltp family lipoprotein n=1 Tax=Staphylococcus sp. EZ-P03 TaxID=2282739 RepID=UPI000DF738F9|nr:Ltp family lipoprotein [Staphylococcus sp. EZ-P03]
MFTTLLLVFWLTASVAFLVLLTLMIIKISQNKKYKVFLFTSIATFIIGLICFIAMINVVPKEEASINSTRNTQPKVVTNSPNKKQESKVPREYIAALKTAESYKRSVPMSKKGLYEQLTSENGNKFPEAAAKYAMEHVTIDYKENAVKSAKSYAKNLHLSDAEILEQLQSENGEKYTPEEAKYGVEHMNDK